MEKHLVIDSGNTRAKLGLFQHGRLVRSGIISTGNMAELHAFLGDTSVDRIAVGSVARMDEAWSDALGAIAPVHGITGSSPAPIINSYGSPATLGVDRLANAMGAWSMFPGRSALAIDLGTCITYDVVTSDGRFIGGAIAPGLRMRAQAMHHFSARLPEVDTAELAPLIGTDTRTSLLSGAFNGVVQEVRGWIGTMAYQYPDLAVVLTGGDAPRIARALEKGIFAHPTLTLLGLYSIHIHALLDPAADSV